MEGILRKLRQIDVARVRFEQKFYPRCLLDDVVVRGKHCQRRLQALELLLDGVTACGTKRRAGIRGEHMLHEAAMHVRQIVGRLPKGESAAPGTEDVAP